MELRAIAFNGTRWVLHVKVCPNKRMYLQRGSHISFLGAELALYRVTCLHDWPERLGQFYAMQDVMHRRRVRHADERHAVLIQR